MRWTRTELTEEEVNDLYKTMKEVKNGEYEKATFFKGGKAYVVDGTDGMTIRIYIWEMIEYDDI